jgi:hypothetical protein
MKTLDDQELLPSQFPSHALITPSSSSPLLFSFSNLTILLSFFILKSTVFVNNAATIAAPPNPSALRYVVRYACTYACLTAICVAATTSAVMPGTAAYAAAVLAAAAFMRADMAGKSGAAVRTSPGNEDAKVLLLMAE